MAVSASLHAAVAVSVFCVVCARLVAPITIFVLRKITVGIVRAAPVVIAELYILASPGLGISFATPATHDIVQISSGVDLGVFSVVIFGVVDFSVVIFGVVVMGVSGISNGVVRGVASGISSGVVMGVSVVFMVVFSGIFSSCSTAFVAFLVKAISCASSIAFFIIDRSTSEAVTPGLPGAGNVARPGQGFS